MQLSSYSLRNNRILFAVLLPLSLGTILLSSLFGVIINVLVLGIIGFVSVFFVSYKYPRYNILIMLSCNFFLPVIVKIFRLYDIPFGVVNEGLCVTMLLTLLLNNRISGGKSVPSILLAIWVLYQFVELANPYTASRIAGVLALRSLIPFLSCFFIMYSSIETRKDVSVFITGWLWMGLMAGLYGVYQELGGLPSWDYEWATSDEIVYSFLFVFGRLRKFSFFFNPSEFGILMSITGMAGLVFAFFAKERWLKIFAAGSSFVCFWAMIYTGSRTAMAIMPVAMLIFAFITLNRKVLIGIAVIAGLGTLMVLRPQSGAMWVMSTAFSGADDPSMNVRLRNREIIRGYIKSNPIGFGLGATGYLGKRYTPGTFIGEFATDSEYVKIAVELGWIGLMIWCVILTVLFGYGVGVYFKPDSDEWRPILTLILTLFFMIMIASYTQEVFISPTISILFSSLIGILAKVDFKISKPELSEGEDE